MPRPKQRRGADARKEEKQAKREAVEAEQRGKEAAEKRARHRKSEMQWDNLNQVASTSADGAAVKEKPFDPDALPEPDADTKAYFQQVATKISELEDLGQGQRYDEDGEEIEDDRPLLLRSALESLNGHEIPLAGDGETSVVMERLLHAMDDAARRVLADRFVGSFEKLSRHRMASHVLQTLIALGGETVDRETRGTVADLPETGADSTLPTMSDLFLTFGTELLPNLPSIIYDPFASHILRSLLRLFSGQLTILPSERSKKSKSFRAKQGPIKSFLAPGEVDSSTSIPNTLDKLSTPPAFSEMLDKIWHSLNDLDPPTHPGEGIRRAGLDEIAGPAVRSMIEIEAASPEHWLKGGWADRVLVGLVEEVANPESATEERTKLRDEYLAGMVRHKSGSATFETLLSKASQPLFERLWSTVFEGQLHRLAGNSVANFVVAVGVTRLEKAQFEKMVREVEKVGTERRGEWIDNSRTGVLQNMLDRAGKLGVCEEEMSHIMLDTFGLKEPKDQHLVIPCIISLNRLEYYKKLPAHVTAQAQMQGSLLLQAWLRMHAPHQQVVIASLTSMSIETLTPFTRDSTSSHVIDAFLTSPTTTPLARRKFLMSLLGHYHTLSDDRIGSRVIEKCWETADVFLKDKIAASVVEHQQFLQRSAWSHFWARKMELPLWERRREEWKLKMATKKFGDRASAPVVAEQVHGFEQQEERKRKPKEVDEVDEIFAKAPKRSRV